MLTREQTARQQQRMTQEALMRAYSEEHTECLKAASRRIGALEGRFTRSEAERTLLHEKLMARETKLYMHKHSLEAAISSLSERAQAIESSHMQHSNMQEGDNSPQRLLGHLDDSMTTQPKPSPSKPLLYPQHVVGKDSGDAVGERGAQGTTSVNGRKAEAGRVEGREAQARQFLLSWCQGDNPSPAAVAAMPLNATITVPVSAEPTEFESVNTST
ncbi:unnamed protein product [Peronospora destructor]|uniref:Uncharacterized protein n=1 Tax=Peronospora destructor TaxID=86335 RepID=A0AAV0T2G8_9STRA|nr:unnamed protein product [Peronospora destructor]